MPRLTPADYSSLHHALRHVWLYSRQAYGSISTDQQPRVHACFAPSQPLTESQLQAFRQAATDRDPGLPQRAGKVIAELKRR
jgi:hypothetical protein